MFASGLNDSVKSESSFAIAYQTNYQINVVAGKNSYFVSWNNGKLEYNHTDYGH